DPRRPARGGGSNLVEAIRRPAAHHSFVPFAIARAPTGHPTRNRILVARTIWNRTGARTICFGTGRDWRAAIAAATQLGEGSHRLDGSGQGGASIAALASTDLSLRAE